MAASDAFVRPETPLISASADRPLDLNAVEIATERLILRPITSALAEQIFAEFTPEITKFLIARSPQHISETERFIAETTAKRGRGSDLCLAILAKESEEYLGGCGLHGRDNAREPELGIWVKKSAHGRGFGREAVAGVRDWAECHLVVDAFVYPVDRKNTASRRIAESLGGVIVRYELIKTMSGGELDAVVYRISARRQEI
jgi:[ribosomal protein S5]-alanine N-acetyltransferase